MGVVSVLAGVAMGCDLVLFSSSCWSNPLNNNLQGVVSLSLEGPVSIRNEIADLASLNRSELLERLKSVLILRFSKFYISYLWGGSYCFKISNIRLSPKPATFHVSDDWNVFSVFHFIKHVQFGCDLHTYWS